jgi:ABC-2 type transport system permease protein
MEALFGTRLWAQIIKELLCVLRDPKSRFILIGPPIIQLLVLSFAITLDVRNADVVILDHDRGAVSQAFVASVTQAQFTGKILVAENERELGDIIEGGHALAGIVIPADFSKRIATRQPATIQLVLDGRRANASQIIAGNLQVIASSFGASTTPSAPIGNAAAVRNWFNPNLSYTWFVVPGLSAVLCTFSALLLTALSIARERELGTFDQLLVSPTTATEIIIAKTAPALVIGTTLGCVMIGAAVFGFQIPFRGSFPILLACLILFIFSCVGIGLAISAVSENQQQAILGTFAAAVPMVLMSGFATPVENMPSALQWIAEAIPAKHFLIILQGSFTKAMPAREIFSHAWPLVVIGSVGLFAATLLTRSKLQ